MDNLFSDNNGAPSVCEECGSEMNFIGTGEYKCSKCGHIMLDNYGKVRRYLEEHPGASISDISRDVGVSTGRIRQMVRDSRFEVTEGSISFLYCEVCGTSIRSGRLCDNCLRSTGGFGGAAPKIAGFAVADKGSSAKGTKRFNR